MDLLWKFEEDCLKNEGQNKLLVNKNSLYGVFFAPSITNLLIVYNLKTTLNSVKQ